MQRGEVAAGEGEGVAEREVAAGVEDRGDEVEVAFAVLGVDAGAEVFGGGGLGLGRGRGGGAEAGEQVAGGGGEETVGSSDAVGERGDGGGVDGGAGPGRGGVEAGEGAAEAGGEALDQPVEERGGSARVVAGVASAPRGPPRPEAPSRCSSARVSSAAAVRPGPKP
ncbi:MAG: hypothetical protein R3F65_08505 [bacterium]